MEQSVSCFVRNDNLQMYVDVKPFLLNVHKQNHSPITKKPQTITSANDTRLFI